MSSVYSPVIVEHHRNPRHFGEPAAWTHRAEGANPSCGDELTLYLSIKDGRIVDAGWQGEGCALARAATSLLTDCLIGQNTEEARSISEEWVSGALGVAITPERERCALLSSRALKRALA